MLFIILLLVFVFVALGGNRKEKFVEMFGFSGYTKPKDADLNVRAPDLSGFVQSGGSITPDEIQSVVLPCQKYFGDKTGVCVYAIETSDIKKYTKEADTLYVVRFMFTVTNSGFPYGVGATFHVLNGGVVGAITQQQMDTEMGAYNPQDSQYLSYDTIVADQRKVILNKK